MKAEGRLARISSGGRDAGPALSHLTDIQLYGNASMTGEPAGTGHDKY